MRELHAGAGMAHPAPSNAAKHSVNSAQVMDTLWSQVQIAVTAAGHSAVVLPEVRTGSHDWVMEGLHMPR